MWPFGLESSTLPLSYPCGYANRSGADPGFLEMGFRCVKEGGGGRFALLILSHFS